MALLRHSEFAQQLMTAKIHFLPCQQQGAWIILSGRCREKAAALRIAMIDLVARFGIIRVLVC